MIADIFTKPLSKIQFTKLKKILHNQFDDEGIIEVYNKLYKGKLINDEDKLIKERVVHALEMLHK
jgi:hypothetical protein